MNLEMRTGSPRYTRVILRHGDASFLLNLTVKAKERVAVLRQ
jgi:hypothetical protein